MRKHQLQPRWKKSTSKSFLENNFGSKHTPENEKKENFMIWTACGGQLSEITI